MISKNKQKVLTYIQIVGLTFVVAGLFLGLSVFRRVNHNPFPRPRIVNSSQIQNWMTIEYISRTFNISSDIIRQKLGYKYGSDKTSLGRIAKDNKIDPGIVIGKVQTIINNR